LFHSCSKGVFHSSKNTLDVSDFFASKEDLFLELQRFLRSLYLSILVSYFNYVRRMASPAEGAEGSGTKG